MRTRIVAMVGMAALLSGTALANAQEFDANWGLRAIGGEAAANAGLTGKGIRIGVIDSGIDRSHPEFGTRVVDGIDFTTDEDAFLDVEGHGTHVAGIIGAAADGLGMQGVAPGAEFVSYKLLGTPQAGTDEVEVWTRIIDHARQNEIHILNASIGAPLLDLLPVDEQRTIMAEQIDVLKTAKDADLVFVFATGNEGRDTASILANLPAFSADLRSSWLAVTAVGPSGTIASYANACGSAAQWCLAAPGGDGDDTGNPADHILSTASGGGYVGYDGTSMAAPHVSGALAIAKEAFPGASYQQLAALTLQTATDIGEAGVDDVYGWGMLNLSNILASASQDHLGIRALEGWSQASTIDGVADAIRGDRIPMTAASAAATAAYGRDVATSRAWIAPMGQIGVIDAGPQTGRGEASSVGVVGGLDLLQTPVVSGGVFGGLTSAKLISGNDESGGTGVHAGAYASLDAGSVFGDAQLGYSMFDARTTRRSIPGLAGTVLGASGTALEASYPDTAFWAGGRFGNRFDVGPVEVSPYLKGMAIQQSFGDGSETGASILAASVAEGTATTLSAGPGVRIEVEAARIGSFVLTPSFEIAYVRHFGDLAPTRSGTVLGTSTTTSGPSLGADALELGAGLKVGSSTGPFELSVDYSGNLRANAQTHSVSAGVSMKF